MLFWFYIVKLAGKKNINQPSHSKNFDFASWFLFNREFCCRLLAARGLTDVYNNGKTVPGEKRLASVRITI